MDIVIGTKAWSTWSLRPWLALKRTGAPFRETLIALRRDAETKADILVHSPSGFVPALKVDGLTIWDSLAICEYLADRFPQARLWPQDPVARALARAAAAEMHSGFRPLRMALAMDLFEHFPGAGLDEPGVAEDIARIDAIFRDCRTAFGLGGPYLFGHRTIADAMYAPVVSRFRTYAPELSEHAAEYVATMLADEGFKAWEDAARREL